MGAHTCIEPATGERLRALNEASALAFKLIKIIELEKSGIRDGDDYAPLWQPLKRLFELAPELSQDDGQPLHD